MNTEEPEINSEQEKQQIIKVVQHLDKLENLHDHICDGSLDKAILIKKYARLC